MFDEVFEDDDDSDEDPTFEDPTDERGKLGKRKRDGRGAHFSKKARLEAENKAQGASLAWMNKTQNQSLSSFQQTAYNTNASGTNSLHSSHYSISNSGYLQPNQHPGGRYVNPGAPHLAQSSPTVATQSLENPRTSTANETAMKAAAAETQVKQFIFEHFQRVSMGSYPREASMAILKQNMRQSTDYLQALGRIQARAASKGSVSQITSRKLQAISSRGNFAGAASPSYPENKPNPPLVKQRLNMEMASSLLRQGDGSTMNALQDFESEANKVTEEELARMSELDRRIYLTLKHCESISIRLRRALQENLKVLLESNSLPASNEEKDNNETSTSDADTETNKETADASGGVSNWLPQKDSTNEETNKEDESTKETETQEEAEAKKTANEHIVREQPGLLQLALKEYQLVGLNWLNLLNKEGVNGILADEMGLGKTIQTISLLALLYEREVPDVPHLIICPSTTLANWLREIYKWCPVFKVIAYYGSPDERERIKQTLLTDRFDIVVTTYNIAGQKKDRLFLKKREFNYVILDEAQSIKNNQSLRHKYLRKLDSRHRLLLTGTPLQNNLDELWALLQFIMPDLFDFDIDFQNEKNSGMNDERVNRMKAIMAPFVLRRLKQHVSRDLPPKAESVQLCDMTPLQKELYISCVQQSRSWWEKLKNAPVEELDTGEAVADAENDYHSDTEENPAADAPPKRKRGRPRKNDPPPPPKRPPPPPPPSRALGKTLNNVFMQLRKIANHPLLVRTYYTDETLQTIGNYLMTLDENKRQRKTQVMDDLYQKSDFRIHQMCKEKAPLSRFMLSPQQLQNSGKIQLMKELLQKLQAEGHRVLIFSQMTRVLDVLQEVLGLWGYEHLRLDGSTPVSTRQGLIDRFNHDNDVFIFLLSTRAGGVGINLTAADTVIFYDIAFNPQVDRQAEDRCHRFGQVKPVTIYKLITSRTVDQNMLQMAERKARLNDIMLEEGSKKREQTKVWQLRSLLSSVFEEIQ